MPDQREVYVSAHNLTLRGTTYRRGEYISLDITLPSVKALIHEGTLELKPRAVPSLVDKPAEIKHNSAINSKPKGGRNGRKRNSKPRAVRDAGEAVHEGLSGAESPD